MRSHRLIPALLIPLLAVGCSPQPEPGAAKASTLARVPVNGGELEYRVTGQGEPVLLIHGSIFADVFDQLVPQPALANYQLINYHRRGFAGSSRALPPFTLEQQAADAVALLDRVGIRSAHLVGHSYGGSVALQIAQQYPDRVATLALLEPAIPALTPMDPQLMQGVMRAVELHGKGDARGAIIEFANVVAPGAWDELTAQGATAMQNQGIADAATFFNVELPALGQWQFSAADIARIRVPVIVVLGGRSVAGAKATHNAVRRALPSADELVVPNAGHGLQMEQPVVVAEGLAAFLRKHRIN